MYLSFPIWQTLYFQFPNNYCSRKLNYNGNQIIDYPGQTDRQCQRQSIANNFESQHHHHRLGMLWVWNRLSVSSTWLKHFKFSPSFFFLVHKFLLHGQYNRIECKLPFSWKCVVLYKLVFLHVLSPLEYLDLMLMVCNICVSISKIIRFLQQNINYSLL